MQLENNKTKCFCNPNYDIRNKCEPKCIDKNTLLEFNNCSERISTMCFLIWNQYDLYQKAINNDFSFLSTEYNMSQSDIQKVIKMFKEEMNE